MKSVKEIQVTENSKKVTVESSNIELIGLRDKCSDVLNSKLIRKDQNAVKPAFSTRNVLNVFSNNDLIKKIECLKSHKKLIVNIKGTNVIDLSEHKNKLKINVLGSGNKENSYNDNILKSKASGKNNAMGNVITINNNVTNNINIGEAPKN